MANFPTLTDQPDVNGWEESRAFDPAIRSRSEGGYVKTRPRTTRVPMQWKLRYSSLSLADKTTLQTFEGTVNVGADAFTWTNPADGQAKLVRFKEPVKYSPAGSNLVWTADLTLEEV